MYEFIPLNINNILPDLYSIKETTNFILRMLVEQRLQLELIAKKRRQNRNKSYQHGIKEVYRRIQQSKK